MIYTLTMNPAIDYITTLPELNGGAVNRSSGGEFRAAGKGINVSAALNGLGVENVALYVCGKGFFCDKFKSLIRADGLKTVQITSGGCDMRLNIKLCHGDFVTEINESFSVDENAAARVRESLLQPNNGDIVAICGSLPLGIDDNFYASVAAELAARGIKVIIDTSGQPLVEVVKSGNAWLIAPNRYELCELENVGVELTAGKPNVLATFGKDGATLTTADNVYTRRPARVESGYAVGAGDNLLAGFIAAYINDNDYEKALSAGIEYAAGYVAGKR